MIKKCKFNSDSEFNKMNIEKYNLKKPNIYILIILLSGLGLLSLIPIGKSFTNNFTSDIDEFKELIQNSPDECWRKPAKIRKDVVLYKLSKVQELIYNEIFEDAYNKMLYDIKPKLTGLKTNEEADSWGDGVFKNPWIICEDLKELFLFECDLILSEINPLNIYDDDTPPTIEVQYEGGYTTEDVTEWIVHIKDLESGLKLINITVDGEVRYYDDQLDGTIEVYYNVAVPPIEGFHVLRVWAINNDGSPDESFFQATIEVQPPGNGGGGGPIIIG